MPGSDQTDTARTTDLSRTRLQPHPENRKRCALTGHQNGHQASKQGL